MLREIIEINESLCDGCGQCIPTCHEGALQIIDDKAHLISDLMCDGLGECVGHCPTGAMQVIKREATPYDERKVMDNIIKGGENVIKAHLAHMLAHQEVEHYNTALQVLSEKNIPVPEHKKIEEQNNESNHQNTRQESNNHVQESELSHWPIQLHLINPASPTFNQADILLAADCTAFASGEFHTRYLAGKKLLVACPKLDSDQDIYIEKLSILLKYGQINSLTLLRMDVPCCGGLAKWIKAALGKAKQSFKLSEITINKQGEIVNTK